MKLSIVIPVYNVEAYVKKCLDSVINQTAKKDDYEVVVVNDGSTDNSLSLIEAIDWGGTNHIIHTQTNGGLSAARNKGRSLSQGEYIWYVDSDDWIENDSVQSILNNSEGDPDLIVTSQMFANNGNTQRKKYSNEIEFNGRGAELLSFLPPTCAPCYICKKSFLDENGLYFKEGLLHEDADLIPRLIHTAKMATAFRKPLYHHFLREGSITHTVNPKRISSYFQVMEDLIDYYENINDSVEKRAFSQICIPHFYGMMKLSLNAEKNYVIDIENYIRQHKVLLKWIRDSIFIKDRIFGYLTLIMPIRYTKLYRLLKG